MIGDGDEQALLESGADASGGVGDDEGLAAEEAEDAGGEGDLGDGVALIGVDAALHDGDGDSGGDHTPFSASTLRGIGQHP